MSENESRQPTDGASKIKEFLKKASKVLAVIGAALVIGGTADFAGQKDDEDQDIKIIEIPGHSKTK